MINDRELLFVVDEDNKPLPPLTRKVVHENKMWHRTTHVWVVNQKGEVLCQKRSLAKDIAPGKWEAWFGGHMGPNAMEIDSAIGELKEETGLRANPEQLNYFKTYKCLEITEFQAIFLYRWNGNISELNYEKEEIDELKWVSLKDLKSKTLNDPQWQWRNYANEMFNWLESQIDTHLKT